MESWIRVQPHISVHGNRGAVAGQRETKPRSSQASMKNSRMPLGTRSAGTHAVHDSLKRLINGHATHSRVKKSLYRSVTDRICLSETATTRRNQSSLGRSLPAGLQATRRGGGCFLPTIARAV